MAVAQGAIELSLEGVIGFSGGVKNGLAVTTCGGYVVYALGSTVVVKNLANDKQCFLAGHTGNITCLAVSNDGAKLASGQTNHIGVKAEIIVWDLDQAKRFCDSNQHMGEDCVIHRLSQHLGRVQDVSFSFDSRYLASLGGRDDNALVVWDTDNGQPICGAPAASEAVKCVKWYNNRSDRIVTAGTYHVKVWFVDFSLPKLHSVNASMGSVRRIFDCISVQEDDSMVWCGSQTGDVVKLKLDDRSGTPQLDGMAPPTLVGCSRDRVPKGVSCIHCILNPSTGNTNALIGGADGTMVYMNTALNIVAGRRAELMGGITAMHPLPDGSAFYCGTDQANRYVVPADLSRAELKATCHIGPVHQLCFPRGCSDLIVSCSANDIRVWNLHLRQELLRIQVPNLECLCCQITPSGSTIVSGWDDGKIRAFFPESGRLKFVINDAHLQKVTALAVNDDDSQASWRIVSGGQDGRVRVWSVTATHQRLLHTMKEHRGPVQFLKINHDSTQCVSASADGSCIVWDLERYVRYMAFFEPTVFEGVLYHPDESQILTCGTNHKLTYWDASDGNAIRVISGGERAMTALDIDSQGEYFFTGSEDSTVKVWHYDDGIAVAVGQGHSGTVNSLCISPDHRKLVSAGSEGSIFIWSMPPTSQLAAVLDGDVNDLDIRSARSVHDRY